MEHVYISKESKRTIILLHGTGGNENDLLQVGGMIDPTANLLGIRGNVLENGMPRYFRRLAEGIFDMEDLRFRTKELEEEIMELSRQYDFSLGSAVGVGYSNGANILAHLLLTNPNLIQTAILFHPMVPDREIEVPDLSQTNVLISAGMNDPICPKEESEDLFAMFSAKDSNVDLNWELGGHQLTYDEVLKSKDWLFKQ